MQQQSKFVAISPKPDLAYRIVLEAMKRGENICDEAVIQRLKQEYEAQKK